MNCVFLHIKPILNASESDVTRNFHLLSCLSDNTSIIFWKGLRGKPGVKGDKGESGKDVSALLIKLLEVAKDMAWHYLKDNTELPSESVFSLLQTPIYKHTHICKLLQGIAGLPGPIGIDGVPGLPGQKGEKVNVLLI